MYSLWAAAACWIFAAASHGYDITDKFSVGGVLSGAYQYQTIDDKPPGISDTGRGAIPFQPEFSFRPGDQHELFAAFGFAAGNALNDGTSPFVIAPWAADLEDDVKDINGRNRDYLLQAWYKYTFKFSDSHTLGITGGIIDATSYLDENAFANDEYTQFMNNALVNAGNAFFPSYDIGGAVEWDFNNFYVNGVYMNVGENDEGNNYNYFGLQFGYRLQLGLGEGNYRIIADTTTDEFADKSGSLASNDLEALSALFISIDQELGDVFGVWLRCGWQRQQAIVNYGGLYSGGVNINGNWWGRDEDNIGIGAAYLNNGNTELDDSTVFELYYRFVFNDYIAATADIQYMKDDYKPSDMEDPNGWIFGLRATVEF
jgi:porin